MITESWLCKIGGVFYCANCDEGVAVCSECKKPFEFEGDAIFCFEFEGDAIFCDDKKSGAEGHYCADCFARKTKEEVKNG